VPEPVALEAYTLDPEAARPFLLAHLGAIRSDRLREEARLRGDEELYFALHRRDVKPSDWLKELQQVAEQVADPAALVRELKRRHPTNFWDLNEGLYHLLLRRGRDAFPYVLPHLRFAWHDAFGSWYGKFFALAQERGWLDLWALLVRLRGAPAFNDAVLA